MGIAANISSSVAAVDVETRRNDDPRSLELKTADTGDEISPGMCNVEW
jgi:hypothetical protein